MTTKNWDEQRQACVHMCTPGGRTDDACQSDGHGAFGLNASAPASGFLALQLTGPPARTKDMALGMGGTPGSPASPSEPPPPPYGHLATVPYPWTRKARLLNDEEDSSTRWWGLGWGLEIRNGELGPQKSPPNYLEERLLDQAQVWAPSPPPPLWGVIRFAYPNV